MTTEKITLKDVYEIVARLEEKMETTYVTKAEFWPVKSIVYGGASIVLLSVFSALVYMVVVRPGI